MKQSIKSITFKGELEVWGIYNFNGPKKRKDPNSNKWLKNNIGAKKFTFKTGEKTIKDQTTGKEKIIPLTKEVDYTSSRCIRHELFKDIQPRQPSDKIFAEKFIQMAASEIGLLRGYMSPDEKNDSKGLKGLKRLSPLYIADAQTIDKVDIVFDQGSSSKPKESDKKNKKGEDKSDTSMFSKDNAPHRKQELLGGINLKELQFLSLDEIDNDFCMIPKGKRDDFIILLKKYFKDHNVDDNLKVEKYIDKGAIYETKREGILLNQDQIRHLVKMVFQRIKMLNGLKAGARLAYKKDSLKASFFDGNDNFNVKESDLKNKLNEIKFFHFFEKI